MLDELRGQVAVGKDGRIYVSDGYCNSRVAQFSGEGVHEGDFVLEEGEMNVPHSLVLDECKDRLMVADRENARVHQFELSSRRVVGVIFVLNSPVNAPLPPHSSPLEAIKAGKFRT
jgi:hypothetical protein